MLNNTVDARHRLAVGLRSFAAENHIPEAALHAVDLALEEHLTNVWSYAFDDPGAQQVLVRLALSEGELVAEIEDRGRAFNPLDAAEADTNLPLEEKPFGGLGIHLMRQFMDELSYQREHGKNVLRMSKRLATPGS